MVWLFFDTQNHKENKPLNDVSFTDISSAYFLENFLLLAKSSNWITCNASRLRPDLALPWSTYVHLPFAAIFLVYLVLFVSLSIEFIGFVGQTTFLRNPCVLPSRTGKSNWNSPTKPAQGLISNCHLLAHLLLLHHLVFGFFACCRLNDVQSWLFSCTSFAFFLAQCTPLCVWVCWRSLLLIFWLAINKFSCN